MSAGPAIQYKFTQSGIEDLKSQIKSLHEEFRNGEITYQQYHSGIKDATAQGRAATQEFSQMKGAIAAANPELLEYTRTMSTFGSVANTVLGITNAINLAQMAGLGLDKQVADDKVNLAAATNQAAKDLAAFGPNSAQYQTDLQLKDALTNKLAYDQNQLAYQSVSTSATLVASAVAIAGSISQSIIGLKALDEMMSPQIAENFAIALAGVGTAALTILAPIAIVVAAIEGIYYAYRALSPQFAATTDEIYNSMIANWHLDTLSAALLAPFVTFLIGLEGIGDQVENLFIGLYNGIVSYFINPLITAWDSTMGHITGDIQKLSPQNYIHQTLQDAMSEIGLGSASPKTSPSSTSAGNINQMLLTGSLPGGSNPLQQTAQQQLEQQLVTGSTTSQILDAQRQAAATLSAANSGLVTINTSVAPLNDSLVANTTAVQAGSALVSSGISSLTTAMTAAQKAQQDAVSAALQSVNQQIQDLPNQIAQAQQQFNQAIQNEKDWTNSVMPYLNANPNVNMGDMAGFDSIVQGVRDAQAKLQQLQSVGPQLQQQAQNIMAGAATQGILDVSSTGVQSLLSSMGMDSASGIGSVIASALGSYGSAGGAGITQQQLQQFANTGDYGIFSGAESSGEVYDKGIITTYSQEATDPNTRAQLYYNTLKGEGFSSSEASTYTQSQYKGATFTAAAAGLEGVLSTPTMILAGEAGPEQVSITPLSRGGGRGGSPVNITITVQGSIISDNDFKNKLNTSLKQMLREVGFT